MNTRTFFIVTLFFAGILVADKSYSQVYVNAHVGFGLPVPRVYCDPPPVVYEEPCPAPAPVYEGYGPGRVVVVDHGYGYYHDRYDHRGYGRGYRDFDRRDHGRRDDDHRGYEHRDFDRRGYDHRDHGRGWEHGRNW